MVMVLYTAFGMWDWSPQEGLVQSKFWESSKQKWEVNQRSSRMHTKRWPTTQAAGVEPRCGVDRSCGLWTLTGMERRGQALSTRTFSKSCAFLCPRLSCHLYLCFSPFSVLSQCFLDAVFISINSLQPQCLPFFPFSHRV